MSSRAKQVFIRALALDPRSVSVARRLTYNLIGMHRLPEALASADRALALDSTRAGLPGLRVAGYLSAISPFQRP
jgi:hypothetical protein